MTRRKQNETIIEKLKKELLLAQKEYHFRVYEILDEIYRKRLQENKKYSLVDLSKESVICDMYDYHYIVTIMEIRRITKQTKKQIEKGVFTVFEVANSLRKSRILHNAKRQDEFFKFMEVELETKKMTKKEFRDNVTLLNNGMKKDMSEENVWLLQTVYEIRAVKRFIIDRYSKLTPLNKIKVKREVESLHQFVSDKMDKDYSLVYLKKDTLKRLRLLRLKGIGGLDTAKKIERLVQHHLTKDIAKCKNCGNPFEKKRKDQLCCSAKCKQQKNRKKAR